MQSMINSVGIRWSDGAAGVPLVQAARPSPPAASRCIKLRLH